MREIKARGLCIKSIDYAENDKLITLYLLGIGKILCRAKGIRKSNAKLKFAAMPMTVADFIVFENKGYFTLKTAEIIYSHSKLWQDIEGVYLAAVMLELLDRFALEGDQIDSFFTTVCDFLDEAEKKPPLTIVNKYLAEFLKYGGYDLRTNSIAKPFNTLYYSPRGDGFNLVGNGIKIDSEVYKGLAGANNFCDNERDIALSVFKLILYHIEELTDVKLRSAKEYLELMGDR